MSFPTTNNIVVGDFVVGDSVVGDSVFGGYVVGEDIVGHSVGSPMGGVGEDHRGCRRLDPTVDGRRHRRDLLRRQI